MATETSAWIDVVLARAAELRAAGVLVVTNADGSSVQLAPLPPKPVEAPPKPATTQAPVEHVNALNDPASYADGIVPGWDIEKLTPEEY